MIRGLIIAWILTLFNFDAIFITAINEIFNKEVSIAVYYFVFAIIGLVLRVIAYIPRG